MSVFSLLEYFEKQRTCPQGRRRVLKSGTAIERHKRSARAESASRGESTRGGFPPLVRGVRGISPREIFKSKMSVEAI